MEVVVVDGDTGRRHARATAAAALEPSTALSENGLWPGQVRAAMKLALLAAALLAALALAGCSGSSGPVTPQKDAEGRYVIHMAASANKFLPARAEVPAGATVVWVNDGATPHDVNANDGSFSSDEKLGGKIGEGDEFEHGFAASGTFSYHCSLHAGMNGSLTVASA